MICSVNNLRITDSWITDRNQTKTSRTVKITFKKGKTFTGSLKAIEKKYDICYATMFNRIRKKNTDYINGYKLEELCSTY